MPSVANGDNMVVGNIHITGLSDEELYSRLMEQGLTVGPIVDSTRELYQRKLYNFMIGTVSAGDTPTARRLSSSADNSPTMERRRKRDRTPVPPKHIDSFNDVLEPLDNDVILESNTPATPTRLYPILDDSPLVVPTAPSAVAASPYSTPPTRPVDPAYHDHLYHIPTNSSRDATPDRSPFYPTMRKAMFNGESPNYSTMSSDYSGQSRNTVNWRSMSNRNDQSYVASTTATAVATKNKKWQTTMFEIFLVVFLLIVGYIFYREVQLYAAAEREYIDSQAPNMNVNQ